MRTVLSQQVNVFIYKELSITYGNSALALLQGTDKMLISVANISVLGYCFSLSSLYHANCISSCKLH